MPSETYQSPVDANFHPTNILNYDHLGVQSVVAKCGVVSGSKREFLQAAHRYLMKHLKPVYRLNEFQSASDTLNLQRGSCSQRMACLEAFARTLKIGTRVHGLWVDGAFWKPRFPFTHPFIPRRILLAWPQFYLTDQWTDFDEIHATAESFIEQGTKAFTNRDTTLFDAVAESTVDLFGKSKTCRQCTGHDLSGFVLENAGIYNTRDELFAQFGSFHSTWRGRIFEMIYGGRKSSFAR